MIEILKDFLFGPVPERRQHLRVLDVAAEYHPAGRADLVVGDVAAGSLRFRPKLA